MTLQLNQVEVLVKNNLPFDEQKLTSWGEGKIIGFSDLISFIKSDDFKTILSATFVLSLLIGLFLPHLAWAIPIIAALGVGLLANFQISLGFIIALSIIMLLPGLSTTIKTTYNMIKSDPKSGWYNFVFWLTLLLSPLYFWDTATSARWLAFPTIMIVLYLLLLISIIIPTERAERPIPNNEHRLVIQTEQKSSQDDVSLDNINTSIVQITEYLKYVEQQLSDLQLSVSLLSQKYSALIKVARKGEIEMKQGSEVTPPTKNA